MLKRAQAYQTPTIVHLDRHESSSPYVQPFRQEGDQIDDNSSTTSRRRILKRTRDDSSSNSKERRLRTDPGGFQILSMKKLEDIMKTMSSEAKQPSSNIDHNTSFDSTKQKPKSAVQCSESQNQTQVSSYKYLRSIATNSRADAATERKVIDCKVRPGTPRKQDEAGLTKEERRLRQLQRIAKQHEEQLKEYTLLRLEHEDLQLKYKKDTENIGRLVDKINELNRQKEQAEDEARNLKLQVNTCKKVTLITSRSESSDAAIKERQNKELKAEVSKLKQDISRLKSENMILKKSKEQYEEQVIDYERNHRARLDEQVRKVQSEREKQLEARIEELKKEIHALENSNVYDSLREMEECLGQQRQQLKKERVLNHCLQRQLEQVRAESNKKIEASIYNELRQSYTTMMSKYRQYVAKHSSGSRGRQLERETSGASKDELFELTPQK